MALIQCAECGKDVSSSAKACPHCGCVIEKKTAQPKERYALAKETNAQSNAAKYMAVLAWLVWVGGLILSIVVATQTKTTQRYPYEETAFSFSAFLSSFAVYVVSGGVLMCMKELFQNLATISSAVCTLSLVQGETETKEKTSDPTPVKVTFVESTAEKEDEAVVVDRSGGVFACPKCYRPQRSDRTVCFYCGTKFADSNSAKE